MFTIKTYRSLKEKIKVVYETNNDTIKRPFYDRELMLEIHHGVPILSDLENIENIKDLIGTNIGKRRRINMLVGILKCGNKIQIGIDSNRQLTPKDVEEAIKYLELIGVIKKVNYEIDLEDEECKGYLRYIEREKWMNRRMKRWIEIRYRDSVNKGTSCFLFNNNTVKLPNRWYDPTIMIGLIYVANNIIHRRTFARGGK